MTWFKRGAREKRYGETSESTGPNLATDLKLERLGRVVHDFPGRTEGDLARMIYGHDDPTLVAEEVRKLEAAGTISRDRETGGLYAKRG